MSDKPYYMAYEDRYKRVHNFGVERWGYSPQDEELSEVLTAWVKENDLTGKRIIEFACGEGGPGAILSKLGCIYRGVDIAPSAIGIAQQTLSSFPDAEVSLMDMVNRRIREKYDAALDVMGFHMLVTDSDRAKYLRNAFRCLERGAPMLFFRESYRENAYEGNVLSFDQWRKITGNDYDTPEKRIAKSGGRDVEVYIPLIPARSRTKKGYEAELEEAGFIIDDFKVMEENYHCPSAALIYVHKP